jgi:hypothetical protein
MCERIVPPPRLPPGPGPGTPRRVVGHRPARGRTLPARAAHRGLSSLRSPPPRWTPCRNVELPRAAGLPGRAAAGTQAGESYTGLYDFDGPLTVPLPGASCSDRRLPLVAPHRHRVAAIRCGLGNLRRRGTEFSSGLSCRHSTRENDNTLPPSRAGWSLYWPLPSSPSLARPMPRPPSAPSPASRWARLSPVANLLRPSRPCASARRRRGDS